MRPFAVYTGMRVLVFVATFAVVAGIWMLSSGSLNWFYSLLIAFVVSGIASYTLLNRQREAFAGRVDQRANRMVEAMRARDEAEEAAQREAAQREAERVGQRSTEDAEQDAS